MEQADHLLLFLMLLAMAMVGLCLGSFASAIAYRIMKNESWIFIRDGVSGKPAPARSYCPSCHHPLRAIDLLPLLSWMMTGGKCRYCQVGISIRYPLIEVTGAIVMVLCYLTGSGIISLALFSITLPFSLACILVLCSKSKPSFFVLQMFILNIAIFFYAVGWGRV